MKFSYLFLQLYLMIPHNFLIIYSLFWKGKKFKKSDDFQIVDC